MIAISSFISGAKEARRLGRSCPESKRSTYEDLVVVGGSWFLHVAESNTFDARQETTFPDEPISLLSRFVLGHLLHHDAKDIGDMFIQRTRFSNVLEGTVELRYGVLG